MNKDNKQTNQSNINWKDIAAWSVVIFGLVIVAIGIVYGIVQMGFEIQKEGSILPTLYLSLSLTIATLIAFAIVFTAVYFLFWDKIKEGLDTRQKNIKANIAITNYKTAQAEKNYQASEEQLANTEKEGKEILADSKREASKVKKEILAEAKDQSEDMLVQTRTQIEREKLQMEDQIRQEILETSLLAAEKIIEKELDPEANKRMIEELIESLK